jgi:c(7)-type cytochrome triheme protein
MAKLPNIRTVTIILALLLLALAPFVHPPTADARTESRFLTQFKKAYEKNSFNYLKILVKKNKASIGDEVDALLEDSRAEGLSYPQRMHYIDLAATIATIHKEWNGDAAPLERAERIQFKELREEQARAAEVKKWRSYELVLGNWALRKYKDKMDAEKLPYVIYPHWLHQIWFECRICHTGLFEPKRGANDITKNKIIEGKFCGRCHNGEFAFKADENCERCHIVGTPKEARLREVDSIDMEMIAETSKRLGVEWHPEKLPDGKIPVDRFNFVDWKVMNELGVFKSLTEVNDIKPRTEKRDTKILYPTTMSFVKDAVFDHAKHTPRMLCVHCHPKVFKPELGVNHVKMGDMGAGGGCGYCHGKTAFKLAGCKNCHSHAPDAPADGMLYHHERPAE